MSEVQHNTVDIGTEHYIEIGVEGGAVRLYIDTLCRSCGDRPGEGVSMTPKEAMKVVAALCKWACEAVERGEGR